MARTRSKNSSIPFGGLGLDKEEEKQLQKLLEDKSMSLAKLKRKLVRDWMKDQKDVVKA